MVVGTWRFFWCQGGGGGLGPPPNTRLLPVTSLAGGASKSCFLGPLGVAGVLGVRAAALRVRRSSGSPRPILSATSCVATVVAGWWVGELVPFDFCTSSQAGGSFGATGSVGGLGSTQIYAEPGESHGGGATSLPTVKYPAVAFSLCVLSSAMDYSYD